MTVDQEILDRFKERIAASLEEQPLSIAAAEHGRRLRDMLAQAGGQNHFELLGISVGANDEVVAVAYEALARVTHPRHARNLGMPISGPLDVLFERLTEAYLALSDKERRRDYLAWLEPPPRETAGEPGPPEERRGELSRMACDAYRNALSLAARADFFPAISLLEHAVALDPKSEYLLLLARCQAQNPRWFARAVASLQRAIELEPESAELHCTLAELHEQAGEAGEARARFHKALALLPGLERAREGLDRLGAGGFRRGR